MPRKVRIEVQGLDQYVFTDEGRTRVLSIKWDFDNQAFYPFSPKFHSDFTTISNRCFDLRKPYNHRFFHKNVGYFFSAIVMVSTALHLGHRVPTTLTIED